MNRKKTVKEKKPKICLVLQGGGALGAYHIGAFQAMDEAGYTPDWFAGISIGAFNATILAGNTPEARLEKLELFWNEISRPGTDASIPNSWAEFYNMASVSMSLMFGQPNFFKQRLISPYFALPGTEEATSFYNTEALFTTLGQLSDFELVNSKSVRLTLGATRVTDGELVFFDNYSMPFGPEHAIASGSLPPGFPATEVDGELYWDGGVVSNTPLDGILDLVEEGEDLLIFMVDLWNANGDAPQTMDEVLWRQKEIQYASRTRHHIDSIVKHKKLEHDLKQSLMKVDSEAVGDISALKAGNNIDIVHITYDAVAGHISSSDTEFSRRSIQLRRDCGYADMKQAIEESPWLHRPEEYRVQVHRKQISGAWVESKSHAKPKQVKQQKAKPKAVVADKDSLYQVH